MGSFNFRSYFNFLSRNKVFTAINLIGFSVALMFVILLGLYVRDELRVDQFHRDKDRIFRVVTDMASGTSLPLGPMLRDRYPEFESVVRVKDGEIVLKNGTENIRTLAIYTDSNFFTFFSFPVLEGGQDQQLQTKQEVTLSESFARKLFPEEDPLGKTVTVNETPLTVTGIAADLVHTHLANPDIYLRPEILNEGYHNHNNAGAAFTYVKIVPGSDTDALIPDILEWFKTFYWPYQEGVWKEVGFEPLTQIYFSPIKNFYPIVQTNSPTFIWILLIVALAILLFAVTNYINLSVAQNGFRAHEAATRRLLGGSQRSLFFNYISESILFCLGAMVLGIVLAMLVEPTFNNLLNSRVDVAGSLSPLYIGILLLGIIVLGGISGIMPAAMLSRFQPIDVVKGSYKRKTKMVYSKVFIGFQYVITIILLGCALTIMRQTRFMMNTDLGYNKENIVYMDNILSGNRSAGLRDRLMQVNGVEAVSFSRGTPLNAGNNNTVSYTDRPTISFQVFAVDSVFWQIMGIEKLWETGNPDGDWVNEETARILELDKDAVDYPYGEGRRELAGVVKNFYIRDLSQKLDPVLIWKLPEGHWPWDILVKISGSNPAETYGQVVAAHLEFNGDVPFDSGFMDASVQKWYDEQERTGNIIGYFSLLAIVISAMGLLAMATYFMRQRALDIAVRKVFGAANGEVLEKLVFSFLKIVLVAFVIAVPVIWYAMSQWLSGYAYRISLNWTIFALAGITAGLIAFAAVFWQSWRAANANPVKTLKQG